MSTDNSVQKGSRYQFLARYGAVILSGGISAIPTALYRYQAKLKLTPQQVWFISAILAKKWDADMPHPSLKRMAQDTGVSEQQLHNYKRSLVDDHWLTIITRHNAQGGQDANYYDFSPLLAQLEELIVRDHLATAADIVPAQPTEPAPGGVNAGLEGGLNHSLAGGVNAGLALKEAITLETLYEEPVSTRSLNSVSLGLSPSRFEIAHTQETTEPKNRGNGPNDPATPTPSHRGFEALREVVGRLSIAREPQLAPPPVAEPPRQGSDDPVQPPPVQPRRRRTRQETDLRLALRPYLEQYAEQLGDEAPLSSTVTRAMHLFERSNLTIDGFIAQLQQAQRETQRRSGSIKKQRSRRGPGPFKNKMSYFFGILEDYLGLKELPLLAASANQSAVPHRESSAPKAPRRRTVGGPMVRVDSLRHNDDDALTPPERPFSAHRSPSNGLEAADGTN